MVVQSVHPELNSELGARHIARVLDQPLHIHGAVGAGAAVKGTLDRTSADLKRSTTVEDSRRSDDLFFQRGRHGYDLKSRSRLVQTDGAVHESFGVLLETRARNGVEIRVAHHSEDVPGLGVEHD